MNSELVTYNRLLNMDIPVGQSAFLWGARKTGKSTYLRAHFSESVYYDLLKSDLHQRYTKEPYLLREEVLALSEGQLSHPIIIDEVQKIPALLNEVHWLIENTSAYFILCGSSARQLKRGGANLLGGRAWRFEFYPLVFPEIPDFDLLHSLNNGLLPSHYLQKNASRSLNAYVHDYLKEEIRGEGLVRNLPAFSRFLDAVGFSHGEMTNFSNISRDVGVDSKTVKEYYQILIDTLLGFFILPFSKRISRDIITATPKFYLFDVGIANYLQKKKIIDLKGIDAGNSFEQFILLELVAYRGLKELHFDIQYWRTRSGLEVDFVLNQGEIVIEVKISSQVRKADIKGLISFVIDYHPKKAFVVSQDPRPRKILLDDGLEITILPWKEFLNVLWSGSLIQ